MSYARKSIPCVIRWIVDRLVALRAGSQVLLVIVGVEEVEKRAHVDFVQIGQGVQRAEFGSASTLFDVADGDTGHADHLRSVLLQEPERNPHLLNALSQLRLELLITRGFHTQNAKRFRAMRAYSKLSRMKFVTIPAHYEWLC